MAYVLTYAIELFDALIDTLGEEGPYKINTGMLQHNFFLEEEEHEKIVPGEEGNDDEPDIIILGKHGQLITKEDLKSFQSA
ncbi:MAG: hypothetical protein KC414_11635 [Romboutsia sp.]|nr:hypothetical protein [Romboutsia sp.]